MKILPILLFLLTLSFAGDITSLMFQTYRVEGKDFQSVVEELKEKLNQSDLKVLRTLTISEAIKARGVKDFPNYTVLLACDRKEKEDLLIKVPFMSNLIPCSVAVYENKDGSVSITAINEKPYLEAFSKELSKDDRRLISKTYMELRRVLSSVGKYKKAHISKAQIRKIMSQLKGVFFETSDTIKGMSFEDAKTLLKTALDGVNMNILGVEDIRKETPKYSFMLACNLTYGEKILREFPHFGTLAPCRVYLYEKPDGSVGVGYINIQTLIKLYGKHLHRDAVEVFEKADRDIKSAIKEVKGE
ncbi:protein of unknown function DUF302 [Hydrogenobacter thermophilus TK-6]|uniref:DUF302 domain-containing protein n=1 Tax=Hydrogenobacter thermophilus (strain DSM 6534 / IAM 12695 / TK-6) TaxID=608538 RepID=D3DJG8_HYDTT|nr:DUF302 domain-containing protein [Hydrogenobacter thermophilus]ADO45893.1 protein of unknown function DUF302 [Hydrogenobacter thermophilus TK-6]BAI69970.1 hypothetical protein HTH_1521 [Hydrogenobacter thermophilus TK-6]